MKQSALAPVLERNPMGRRQVESILRDSYKIVLLGFWRWLHHYGDIDSPNPPEEIDPYIEMMRHLFENQENVAHHECKICALWMVVTYCWRIAENHENPVRKSARHLASQQKSMRDVADSCLGKEDLFLQALLQLHPPHESRRCADRNVDVYFLTEKKDPEHRTNYKDMHIVSYMVNDYDPLQRIMKHREKLISSGTKYYEAIDVFLLTIEDFFQTADAINLYSQDRNVLKTEIGIMLEQAGFKHEEIADILEGEEPLARNEVGKKDLTEASQRKVENIRKRLNRAKT